jgi:hypothetical protein
MLHPRSARNESRSYGRPAIRINAKDTKQEFSAWQRRRLREVAVDQFESLSFW